MTLEVWKDSQQLGGFVLCVVTVPLCIVTVALRFAANIKSTGKIGMETWFAFVSLIFFLVYTLMFLYLLTILNGKTLIELMMGPPETITHLLKVGWAMSPQFCPNQLFTKASLLLLYRRIFWVHKGFVRWLWAIGTVTLLWTISVYLAKWMLCWPIPYTWDKTLPGGTCFNIPVFLAISETVNSVIDFIMLFFAVRIVSTIQITLAEKIKLSILFSLGSLSGIIGFIKIAEAYTAAYTTILDPIWDIAQMATSIICCCAPTFPAIFAGVHIPSKLSSFFTSLRSSRKSSHGGSHMHRSDPRAWEGNSQHNLAWVRASADQHKAGRLSDGTASDKGHWDDWSQPQGTPYAMRTIEARQHVDYV